MNIQKIYRQSWMKSRTPSSQRETDIWYVNFANDLLSTLEEKDFFYDLNERNQRDLPLFLTWYLEDCVNNSGCWNRFISLHQKYYGRYLPFYDLPDTYMADEVNLEDIYYLLWTVDSALTYDNVEPKNPFAPWILEVAPMIYEVMELAFEHAPITDVDTFDWLYDMVGMMIKPCELPAIQPGGEYKPDVENFLKATGGEVLEYFNTHHELRTFLLDKLHWKEDELFSDMYLEKGEVVFASPKGVLMAPDLSAFFSDPRNPYYDQKKAKKEAATLFYVPGACPFDLLKYAEAHHLLDDAAFSFPDGHRILHENWDFIARRYLGFFYEVN